MKLTKNFHRIDKVLQLILLVPTIFAGVVGIGLHSALFFYVIGLFFLGCWQVISGVIVSLGSKSEAHIKYLLGVAFYFTLMLIVSQNGQYFKNEIMEILGFVYVLALPIFIAIWYFNLTRKTIEGITEAKDKQVFFHDVLDNELFV